MDEWNHRKELLAIMRQYDIPVSKYYETRFYIINMLIFFSCHIIGWFMPFYFSGRLESGNACGYFRMKQYFNETGIQQRNEILYEIGIKEKEHEGYLLGKIIHYKLLPFFENVFARGGNKSLNNVNLDEKYPIESLDIFCKKKTSEINSYKKFKHIFSV